MSSKIQRTLAEAHQILEEEGANSWIHAEEKQLGCRVKDHEEWLMTEEEGDLRSWARSVCD